MKRVFLISYMLILFCNFNVPSICAQTDVWKRLIESLSEEGVDEAEIENMYQELLFIESNPINLNTVSSAELERFPLISHNQAVSLSQFLERNRPIYTVYELRNVPLFDYKTVELILPFFYVGELNKKNLSLHKIISNGLHEFVNRFDKTLTQRAGFGEFTDSILQKYPNRKYQGEDFYTSMKYSFSYHDKIQVGVVSEKDPGEPFWKKKYSKGYDHYGFHFLLRDVGNLKTLAMGDFRLSFGQGLVLNNNFVVSKSWVTNNIIKRTQQPKRHFSTAEYGFFRGVASVYQINKVAVTAFFSNKQFDSNLSNNGDITSFKTDGYHRTISEIEKKNNTRERVVGANINWRKNYLQIGGSAIYHKYNRILNPSLQNYNLFYLRDSSNYNLSLDYSYRFSKLSVAGETAIAANGAVATLNVLQYNPSYLYSFSLQHRYLPASYNALHARVFSENSRVQNENGLYFGATLQPYRRISITSYVDIFYFPWLKYLVDAPSKGMDAYFLGSYNINSYSDFEIRYKFKQKEQNTDSPYGGKEVLPFLSQKIRLRYNIEKKTGFSFRTSFDLSLYDEPNSRKESGYMVSQNVGYKGSNKFQGDVFVGYFNSDSYASRLYSYERNILSTFYMPSFYGEGVRIALQGRFNIFSRLSISAKLGYSRYFDRAVIGSGTEAISGNKRIDLYTLLRWRL